MTRSSARLSRAASATAIVAVVVAGLASPATAGAIKKPGRYYGVATSQRNPMSFALTANRKALAVARVFGDAGDGRAAAKVKRQAGHGATRPRRIA